MSSRTPLLHKCYTKSSMITGEADVTMSIGAAAPQQVSVSPAAGLCVVFHDVPRFRKATSQQWMLLPSL
jgi:hypothetical protein